jgi:hypothetical protein
MAANIFYQRPWRNVACVDYFRGAGSGGLINIALVLLMGSLFKSPLRLKTGGAFIMLDEQQLMTIIVSAKTHFSIPFEPVIKRKAGKPKRSLYHSLFSAAIVNIGRVHTDVRLGRSARTKDEIRPVRNKKCISRSRNRSKVRVIRVFTLNKIGTMAGIPNHATVIHHFNQHDQNIRIEAYKEFYDYMDVMAQEILSPPPGQ